MALHCKVLNCQIYPENLLLGLLQFIFIFHIFIINFHSYITLAQDWGGCLKLLQ